MRPTRCRASTTACSSPSRRCSSRQRSAARYVARLADAVTAERHKFQLPKGGSLTLTSRRGAIPITVRSSGRATRRGCCLQVASDRLKFPGGDTRTMRLTRHDTTERFTVQSLGSGAFPLAHPAQVARRQGGAEPDAPHGALHERVGRRHRRCRSAPACSCSCGGTATRGAGEHGERVTEPTSTSVAAAPSWRAGTAASRATGFLRVLALAYALGYNRLSDAYNLANTLPNIVYELVLGGVVSATLVPIFVGLFEDDDDPWHGVAAVTWLVIAVDGGLSVLFALRRPVARRAVRRAQPRHARPTRNTTSPSRSCATSRRRSCCSPGMAVGSAILNARRRFAAPMFAPVLNNVVAIAALLAAPHVISRSRDAIARPRRRAVVLGLGTTLGYVAQLVGLVPSLRAVGAKLRPVWDPHHPAVRAPLRLSGWTFGFVDCQPGGVPDRRRAGEPARRRTVELPGRVSVLPTPPRHHRGVDHQRPAARNERRRDAQRRAAFDALFRRGLRVTALLLIPAALVAAVFAEPLLRPLIAHGALTEAALETTASTLSAFALGLPGFSAFILCTRALQAGETPVACSICTSSRTASTSCWPWRCIRRCTCGAWR